MGGVKRTATAAELREEIIRLGPWLHQVQITSEVSTRDYLDAPPTPDATKVTVLLREGTAPTKRVETYVRSDLSWSALQFRNHRDDFMATMRRLYPNGLEGRRVLDCACNCGAYLLWAKELGAGECVGFDVREHWIEQARFLTEHREGPTDGVRFEVCDLYDLPKLDLEPFDIVLFNGILYHIPDPLTGLKIAADLAAELLMVNTATASALPDGMLKASGETVESPVSGVYGLNWLPTGPATIRAIFQWCGFVETRCHFWRRQPGQRRSNRNRIEMFAARKQGLFESFDAFMRKAGGPLWELVQEAVPEAAIVLVATEGDESLLMLDGRCAWNFPQSRDGGYAEEPRFGADGAVAHLEQLRREGAQYLLFPSRALAWLERQPQLAEHLESNCRTAAREEGVGLLFALEPVG
jgi:tRNA (mo5U34)-methyltransferase